MFETHPAVSCSTVNQYVATESSPAQESRVCLSMVMAGLKTVASRAGMSQAFEECCSSSGLPLGVV